MAPKNIATLLLLLYVKKKNCSQYQNEYDKC